ncbi:hypothetical protein NCLIV_027150 [Neospora caninum Liverpool]|uniref:Nucleoporin autopeptidase n=1 Tax=Neospora caninum (strain Liverpool) TaxID=572307 RepID=F0VGT3_NEOCL|nr:hypothetical protein NCLIV_027150 [Neospora caninum Liverpool]CBZ52927.1 hypothetical protein NCLIV_027150 [Neospora caninum Liverpool]CEL66909.1 TPA: nucleoporin autopeptidase [Neospora caninum Liverpool]|eukprot:XP_003882959.1 hypothetical protein NCLIV_027150 [Neospora caninum Liverpool]
MFSSNSSSTLTGGGSLFGSSGGGGGLFGGASTQQQQSGSLFGGTSGFMSQPQQQTQGRLFGNAGTPGMSLFGQQQTTQPQSGGLFGSSATTNSGLFGTGQQQSGGIFGSSSLSQPQQTTGGGGLFGGSNTSTLGSSMTGGGLFGQQPQQTGGLFGSSTGAGTGAAATGTATLGQQQTGGLFGSVGGFGTSNAGGFGTSTLGTAGQQTAGGLFGSQPQGGGLFGSTTSSFGAGGTSTSGFGTFGSGGATGSVLGAGTLQQPFQPHKTEEGLLMSICFGTLAEVSQDEERWRYYQQRGGGVGASTAGTGLFGQQTAPQQTGGLFGNSTGTPAGGGLFGSTPASATGTGLLGSSTQTNQQQSGSLFGASTTGGFGGGLFGSSTSTQPSGQQQTGGLFGNAGGSSTTSGGGLFGSNTLGNATGTSLFGTTPQQTQTGGLFGQQQQTTGGGGLFGSSSLAGTNTGGGLFGASTTPSTGLFGSTTQQSQPGTTATQTGGLFGSTTTPAATTGQATTGTGLFGGLSSSGGSSGGGLFGNTGAATTGGGLFGNTQQQSNLSGGGLFGSSGGLKLGATATGTTPGATGTTGGLFGSSSTAGASGTSGLFGSSGTSGGGLFGSSTAKPGEAGGLFGSSGTSATSGTPFGNTSGAAGVGGGLLGAASASSGSGSTGGLFGSSTTGSGAGLFSSGGLFGSAPAGQQSAAGGSLFGPTPALGGAAGGSGLGVGQSTQTGLFGALGSLSGSGAQGAPASAAAADAYGLASLLGGQVEVKLTLSARPPESSAQEGTQIFPPRLQLLDSCGGAALGDGGLLGAWGSSVWRPGAPTRLCRGRRFRPLGPMGGGLSGSYLSSGASNASFALPEVYIQRAFGTSRSSSPHDESPGSGQGDALRSTADRKALPGALWASVTLERSAAEALLLQRRRKPGSLTPDQVSPWSSTALQFMRSNPFYRDQLAEANVAKEMAASKAPGAVPPTSSQSAPAEGGLSGAKETAAPSVPKATSAAPASTSCPAVPGLAPASSVSSSALPGDASDQKQLGWPANPETSPSAKKPAVLGLSPIQTFSLATPGGSARSSPNGSRTGPASAEELNRWHAPPEGATLNGSSPAGLDSLAACLSAPEDLRPVLMRPDYETVPSIEVLTGMTEQELSRVQDFSITRRAYGSIRWPGYTDLRGINLDDAVKIEKLEVSVYGSEAPPRGVGLNKRAVITLKNCKPRSVKYLDTMVLQRPEDEAYVQDKQRQYVTKVRRYTERMGAKFLDLNLTTGEWTFEVEHFSTYRFLDEDDENDEDLEAQLRQKALSSTTATGPRPPSPLPVSAASPASPESGAPASSCFGERESLFGSQKPGVQHGFPDAEFCAVARKTAAARGGVSQNVVNPEFLRNVSLAQSVNRNSHSRALPCSMSGDASTAPGLRWTAAKSSRPGAADAAVAKDGTAGATTGGPFEASHGFTQQKALSGAEWKKTDTLGAHRGGTMGAPQKAGMATSPRGTTGGEHEGKRRKASSSDNERRDRLAGPLSVDNAGGSVSALRPGSDFEGTFSAPCSFLHLQQRRHCPYPVRCAPVISRDGLLALPVLSAVSERPAIASFPGSLVQLTHLSPLLREEETRPPQDGPDCRGVLSGPGADTCREAPTHQPLWTVGEVPDEAVAASADEEEKHSLSDAAQRYVHPICDRALSLTAAGPGSDASPSLLSDRWCFPTGAGFSIRGEPFEGTIQSPSEQLRVFRDGRRVRRTLCASAMQQVLAAFIDEVVKEGDSQKAQAGATAEGTQECLSALATPVEAGRGEENGQGARQGGREGVSGEPSGSGDREFEWWLLAPVCRQESGALETRSSGQDGVSSPSLPPSSSGLVQRLLLRLLAFFEQQTHLYSGGVTPSSCLPLAASPAGVPLSSRPSPFPDGTLSLGGRPCLPRSAGVPEASYLAPYMLQTWQLLVALMLSSPEQEDSVFAAATSSLFSRDVSPEAILESQRQARIFEWLLRESGREVASLLQRAATLRQALPCSLLEGQASRLQTCEARGDAGSDSAATEPFGRHGGSQKSATKLPSADVSGPLFRLAGAAGQRALHVAVAADQDEERKLLAVFHLSAAGQLYDAVELLLNSRPGEPYYPHLALCLAAHVQQQVGREFLYFNLFRATAPSFLTPPPGIVRLYRLLTPASSSRLSLPSGLATLKTKEGEKRKRSTSPVPSVPAEPARCTSPSKRRATAPNTGGAGRSPLTPGNERSDGGEETAQADPREIARFGLEHFVSWRHQLAASLVFSSASPLEDPASPGAGAAASSFKRGATETDRDAGDKEEKAGGCVQEEWPARKRKGEEGATGGAADQLCSLEASAGADVDMFQRIRMELAPPPQAADAPRELRRALLQFEHLLRSRDQDEDSSPSRLTFALPASPAPLYRQQEEQGLTPKNHLHEESNGTTKNLFDLQYGLLRMHAGVAPPSLAIFDPASHTPYGLDVFFAWTAGVVTLLHRGGARARASLKRLQRVQSEDEAKEEGDAGLKREEAQQLHRLTVAFAAELESLPGCWPWACVALLFTPFSGRALHGMHALIGRHAAEFTCTGGVSRGSEMEPQTQEVREKVSFEEGRQESLRVLVDEVGVPQWWIDEADGLYAFSQQKFMQAAFLFYWAYLRLRLPLVRGFLGSPVAAPLREELLALWSPTSAVETHLLRHAGRALLQCLPGFLMAVLLQQMQHMEEQTRVSRMRRALEKCERLTGSIRSGTARALSDELRAYERQEREVEPAEISEVGATPSVLILSTEAKMNLLLEVLEAIREKLARGLPDLSEDAQGAEGAQGVEKDILASCAVEGEWRSSKFPLDLARLACMERALRWLMKRQRKQSRSEPRFSPASKQMKALKDAGEKDRRQAERSGGYGEAAERSQRGVEGGDGADADFSSGLLREVERESKRLAQQMSDSTRGFLPADVAPDEPAFWIALKTALLEELRE